MLVVGGVTTLVVTRSSDEQPARGLEEVAEPNSAKVGQVAPDFEIEALDGGTVRLPRIVGHARAMDLILTGRPVHADEALQMGLANRVVPVGESLTVAHRLAEEIAAFPQLCMRADRASAVAQWDLPLADALRAEGAGGLDALLAEGIGGADRFASGEGRHGAF